MRSLIAPRNLLGVAGLIFAGGCSSDECIIPPCPPPVAAIISVSSSISGTRVPGAFIKVNGSDQVEPCNQGETTLCYVSGSGGSYQVEIGAPGLASVKRTFTFAQTGTQGCGCPSGDPVAIAVTLTPSSTAG